MTRLSPCQFPGGALQCEMWLEGVVSQCSLCPLSRPVLVRLPVTRVFIRPDCGWTFLENAPLQVAETVELPWQSTRLGCVKPGRELCFMVLEEGTSLWKKARFTMRHWGWTALPKETKWV